MLKANFFSIYAPKSIQNTHILITLGNTIPENKGLEHGFFLSSLVSKDLALLDINK